MPSPPRIFRRAVALFCAAALPVPQSHAQTSAQADSQRRAEAAQAYNEGIQAFNAGKWAEAAEKVAKSISLITDPNEQQMLSAAYFTLGAAYFNVPNYPRRLRHLKPICRSIPARNE
jgi:outer membrane protein assembly factor BamD (BamD/ComL family)